MKFKIKNTWLKHVFVGAGIGLIIICLIIVFIYGLAVITVCFGADKSELGGIGFLLAIIFGLCAMPWTFFTLEIDNSILAVVLTLISIIFNGALLGLIIRAFIWNKKKTFTILGIILVIIVFFLWKDNNNEKIRENIEKEVLTLLKDKRYLQAEQSANKLLNFTGKNLYRKEYLYGNDLNLLIRIYRLQGRYIEAEAYFKKAIAWEEKFGKYRVEDTIEDLAKFYTELYWYEKAKNIYQKILCDIAKNYGKINWSYSKYLEYLSKICALNNEYNKSISYLKKSIEIEKRTNEQQNKTENPSWLIKARIKDLTTIENLQKKGVLFDFHKNVLDSKKGFKIEKEFYEGSDKIKYEWSYYNDVLDGVTVEYDEDGKIKREIPYKNGKLHGILRMYSEMERKRFNPFFEKGIVYYENEIIFEL